MALLHIIDAGPNKILVVKVVRDMFGVGLKEAKECMEGTFRLNIGTATKAVQQSIRAQLTEAGVVKYEILKKGKEPVREDSTPAKTWHERLLDD